MLQLEQFNQIIPTQQRRITVLITLAGVIGAWCLTLPPLRIEPVDLPEQRIKPVQTPVDIPVMVDLMVWDIPEIKEKQPVQDMPVVEKKPQPAKMSRFIPVPQPMDQSPPPIRLPPVKYLGQVIDPQGTQVFLNIDDNNVSMIPQKIYGQTWQILKVDDREVMIRHIPSQQTIHVVKQP